MESVEREAVGRVLVDEVMANNEKRMSSMSRSFPHTNPPMHTYS